MGIGEEEVAGNERRAGYGDFLKGPWVRVEFVAQAKKEGTCARRVRAQLGIEESVLGPRRYWYIFWQAKGRVH